MANGMHWVGTWATAPAPAEGAALSNQTLRMTARISIGGDTLRVRLSNAYGTRPLAIGAAHIGVRTSHAAVDPETDRVLTFGGERTATIAAGALLVSDPVKLHVAPLTDMAVTVYLPGDLPVSFGITGRYARQTNYLSPVGNFASEAVMPVGRLTDEWYVVNGIDVMATADTGGIVALGDSLTDANISTHDAFCRWPDQLARRLNARIGGRALGVMNQGLGGNRILHDIRGDSGLRRFDRDVLSAPGVTHVIVMLGTNDLRNRWAKPEEEVTAEQMIAGLKQMALRAHTRGIRIFGATLTPFENETFLVGAWNPAREAVRQAVNAWIRESGAFDAVVDFDKGLRDPEHPTSMLAIYDCGDHLHPSDLGYNRMGDVIDLSLFD
ncbi:MAG TPA: SGNH/GDSL hydrolase family protein [Acetobacteraceae bacterium]|jgi:lysophospholipase L1-like esterase|nr:SGNH/GDSL hydrolase family protein [Acetobacteraceae bacterium]